MVAEGGDRLGDGTTVALQGDAPPPGGVAANAPGEAPRKVSPPNAEQRQRILDSAGGDPEKLSCHSVLLS